MIETDTASITRLPLSGNPDKLVVINSSRLAFLVIKVGCYQPHIR